MGKLLQQKELLILVFLNRGAYGLATPLERLEVSASQEN